MLLVLVVAALVQPVVDFLVQFPVFLVFEVRWRNLFDVRNQYKRVVDNMAMAVNRHNFDGNHIVNMDHRILDITNMHHDMLIVVVQMVFFVHLLDQD